MKHSLEQFVLHGEAQLRVNALPHAVAAHIKTASNCAKLMHHRLLCGVSYKKRAHRCSSSRRLNSNVFEIVGTKLMMITRALLVRAAANAQGSTSVENSGSHSGVREANPRRFEHIQEGYWDCGDLNHYKDNPAGHSPTAAQAGGATASLFLSQGERGGLTKMR